MRINRYGFDFEIPDEWMKEAKFTPLKMKGEHFSPLSNKPYFIVKVKDINPKIRGEGVSIFKDGPSDDGIDRTAKERTVFILKAIANGSPLPPVEVLKSRDSNYLYRLKSGCHRLHCAIVAGFTGIPAVWGIDFDAV